MTRIRSTAKRLPATPPLLLALLLLLPIGLPAGAEEAPSLAEPAAVGSEAAEPAPQQEGEGTEQEGDDQAEDAEGEGTFSEEIVVTGTRARPRSAVESMVPIDVISPEEFVSQGDTDLSNQLRNLVPSYNVNTQPISATLLTGLLRPFIDSVNQVSAPVIARDRDIVLKETKTEAATDYATLVRLTVTTDRRTRSVSGSLFGGKKPRIVDVEEIPLEAELSPNMLFVRNQDKPGLIGRLGTTLGDAGINIANFHLGRHEDRSGEAIALLSIDQPPMDMLIETVCSLPGVERVKALRF